MNRVNAGRRAIGMYCLRAMTLGNRISWLGERTSRSYLKKAHAVHSVVTLKNATIGPAAHTKLSIR